MAATPYNPTGEYQPESTKGLPALYAWPPRPLAALKYLFFDMLFPWGHLYIGMAFIAWYYLTPARHWIRHSAAGTTAAGSRCWTRKNACVNYVDKLPELFNV